MPGPIGNKNALGFRFSKAQKRRFSLMRKGKPRQGDPKSWKHTKSTKRRISLSMRGNTFSKGVKWSKEARERFSKIKTGVKKSLAMRRKLSKTLKKLFRDPSNCPNWQGGLSFEPYAPTFTWRLRKQIRTRDGFKCFLCLKKPPRKRLHVHHIDYDKKNSDEMNLVSLCDSCHMKTNFRRNYWKILLKRKMKAIYSRIHLRQNP